MQGYVAVTDHGWYERLAYEPGPRDVNFWRPSTRAFRLVPGTPFFFKLKAPRNAVVGFGYSAGGVVEDGMEIEVAGRAGRAPAGDAAALVSTTYRGDCTVLLFDGSEADPVRLFV